MSLKENDFHQQYQHACLLRELGRQKQALKEFLSLYPQGKQLPELNFVIGCTHYDLGNYKQTEEYLERCLALAPYYVPAHECLGKLRWQQGRKNEFLNSFDRTRHAHPPHPVLERSRIAQLLVTGQYEQALDSANWARRHFSEDAQFIHLTGVINKRVGHDEQSIALLRQAATLEPNNPRFQIDIANHEIKCHEYQSAQERLAPLLKYFPDNQELWAYLGICWRLRGDERHLWLNNYQKYIQTFELPVPSNFDNREHFVDALKKTIGHYHSPGQEQPLDQSVQGGSQSEGHLLFLQNPIIQAYRTSLEQVIKEYLASLPIDSSHPLCRHNTGRFKIAGSWSVKLANKGFHTNHIHSQGWLSGPTYLSVPSTIHQGDPMRQGWVKFGETCLGLGDREEVALAVCPKPGQIVLFPSYIWHGTYPFTAESPRMTLPCDISPLG
nr:putative 2OG-Fe(II) oxygenase [Pseudoalteromonas sp. BDTF-M6]